MCFIFTLKEDSTVGIVTRLQARRPRNRGAIPCRDNKFLVTKTSTSAGDHPTSYSTLPMDLFKNYDGRGVTMTTHPFKAEVEIEWN